MGPFLARRFVDSPMARRADWVFHNRPVRFGGVSRKRGDFEYPWPRFDPLANLSRFDIRVWESLADEPFWINLSRFNDSSDSSEDEFDHPPPLLKRTRTEPPSIIKCSPTKPHRLLIHWTCR